MVKITKAVIEEIVRRGAEHGFEFYKFSIDFARNKISFNLSKPNYIIRREYYDLSFSKPDPTHIEIIEILKPFGCILYIKDYICTLSIHHKEYMDYQMDNYNRNLDQAICNGDEKAIMEEQDNLNEFMKEYNQNWFCNGCPAQSEYVLK